MALKRTKIVERLTGRGTVFEQDGEELGRANYEVDVLQEVIDSGTLDDPRAVMAGLKQIEGRFLFLDFNLTAAMFASKTLTVHLDDGRRLDIIPRDAENFEGAGTFY